MHAEFERNNCTTGNLRHRVCKNIITWPQVCKFLKGWLSIQAGEGFLEGSCICLKCARFRSMLLFWCYWFLNFSQWSYRPNFNLLEKRQQTETSWFSTSKVFSRDVIIFLETRALLLSKSLYNQRKVTWVSCMVFKNSLFNRWKCLIRRSKLTEEVLA